MTALRIFGCSFTQGIESLSYGSNWVHYLREKIDDDIEIYSYAQAGTGSPFHSYLFSQVKKNFPNDIYIAQLTNPGRYVWWKENKKDTFAEYKDYDAFYNNVFKETISHKKNLYETLTDSTRVHLFNYGIVYVQYKNSLITTSDIQFAEAYYDRSNENNTWAISSKYLVDNSDFSYFHHKVTMNEYETIFGNNVHIPTSIETQMGSDKFKSHIIDAGDHFDAQGNQFVANYVYDIIKDRL